VLVAVVHRQLVHRLEPRPRQRPRESVVPEEHVGDALAFASRQPGRHERVHSAKERLYHHGAAADEHGRAGHGAAHRLDGARPGLRDRQVHAVALGLRVRVLAHGHDGVREAAVPDEVRVGVLREHHRRRRVHGRLHGVQERGADGDAARVALPLDRPPAALVPQVVGVAPGDQDLGGLLGQGQQRRVAWLAVLEEHQRLPHRLPRQVPVLLLPQLVGEARVGHGVLEQAHGELDAQNPRHSVVDPAHRDQAAVHVTGQDGDEVLVVVWHHDLKQEFNYQHHHSLSARVKPESMSMLAWAYHVNASKN
jgi:hypothetical protein